MSTMTKSQLIDFLIEGFDTWAEVADFMIDIRNLNGWYAYWEGPEPSDFSFCSEDPRGDNTGTHITQNDFESGGSVWKVFSGELPPESSEMVPDREYWLLVNYSCSKSKTPKVCFRKGNQLFTDSFKPWKVINDDTVVRWTDLPELVIDARAPAACSECDKTSCICWDEL